jgi:septum formation protein
MNCNEQYHRIGKDGKKYWGKIGAGIIFSDGKKILLLKRASKGDNFGKWSIPGGKVEKGESPIDGAKRESKEECGYFGGYQYHHYDDQDGKHHYHTFFYAIDKPFEIKLSEEHTEGKWFDISDVDDLNLHERLKNNWPYFKRKIIHQFTGTKSFIDWIEIKEKII